MVRERPSKTRLQAFLIPKFSRGDTPGPPLKRGGALRCFKRISPTLSAWL